MLCSKAMTAMTNLSQALLMVCLACLFLVQANVADYLDSLLNLPIFSINKCSYLA